MTTKLDEIKPIDKATVHRICSGQVVLSLSIAVKELVENSIDAGGTIIDIRLKDHGADLVEVSDNGCGVPETSFEALTLKHYTSKIKEFSDLETVGTLGFRGEALSSLCALSDLSIVTKHESAQLASKIEYDFNGKITRVTTTARQVGTTVTLGNLFKSLPVRRKEFLKNLKREFSKMCQLLYAYCLVSKGIKFTCTNTTEKGSKSTVVATEGHKTVRENIISVFGSKQISTLVDVPLITPNEEISLEFGLKQSDFTEIPFEFEFLVSSVLHGSGRSVADRQFFFINGRPCEPNKLMKLINEIYRQFNGNQYPFVYLNVTTKSALVDVNVTPDKRQIFIEKEKVLLGVVKASLLEVFQQFPSSFQVQNVDVSRSFLSASREDSRDKKAQSKGIKRSLTDFSVKKGSILETFRKRSRTEELSSTSSKPREFPEIKPEQEVDSDIEDDVEKRLDTLIETASRLVKKQDEDIEVLDEPEIKLKTVCSLTKEPDEILVDIKLDAIPVSRKTQIKCSVTLEEIRGKLQKSQENLLKETTVKFRSEIVPEANKAAEDELRKQISKADFQRMSIVGQFNLGFIVAKLDNDLFIIDQHASDEKYNFEQLQANTVIDNQQLVNHKPLELTAGNEAILIENLEIFRKNGFQFQIDPTACCTKKVSLTAVPLSKNIVFGKDDIDEMLFMMQDGNNTMCRPSRVRAMFASRACRKSVMIGKALSCSDMRKLVDHMGEIEQPWNCPHGRPTMRHLINLGLINS